MERLEHVGVPILERELGRVKDALQQTPLHGRIRMKVEHRLRHGRVAVGIPGQDMGFFRVLVTFKIDK